VAPSTPSRPDNAAVSAALERLLASPSFARSPRLASFLRFLVNEYLTGSGASLKEYVLGVQVFDRAADYDPRIDPIVRVQARQLRFKLREYYGTAGSTDAVRFEIPKGCYQATIGYAPVVAARGEHTPAPANSDPPTALPPQFAARHRKSRWVFASMLLVSAAAAGVLFARFAGPSWPHHQAKVDPAAQELYLKGKFCWNQRTPESLNQAVDYFTQAIVKSPGYSKPYSGLADCYNLLREYSVMPDKVAWPRAIAAAQKAVELDDSSAEAHAALGFALFYGALDPTGGERELLRAIQLDPNYAQAHHWYATSLMTIGRSQQAFQEVQRARELNPASASIFADEGYILFFLGQTERAVEVLQQVETTDPSFASPHIYLARIYLLAGDSAGYLSESRKAAELSRDDEALVMQAAARKAFAAGGPRAMLASILQHNEALLAEGRGGHYEVAQSFARLGKLQDAMDQLQAAVENREMNILTLGQDPALARLRGERRFQELRAKLKQTLRI
jgi:hypothetical protein